MYTGRQLTKPRDVLAAFEDITWRLGQYIASLSLSVCRHYISIWPSFGTLRRQRVCRRQGALWIRKTVMRKMPWEIALARSSRNLFKELGFRHGLGQAG